MWKECVDRFRVGRVKGLWFEWHDSYGGLGLATREKQAEARRRSSATRRTKRQLARSSMGAPSTVSTPKSRPKSTRRGSGMQASASCARKRGTRLEGRCVRV